MKYLFIILIVNISAHFSFSQELEKLFVGTFTSKGAEGIYLCDFNTSNGKIELSKTFKGVEDPSFLVVSPCKKYLYCVNSLPRNLEQTGGYVNAYKINENGDLHFINKQLSHGSGPCHIDVSFDGKFVAIANYNSGTTSLYPVNEEGGLNPAATIVKNSGTGFNERRQSAPHAHSIKFAPFDDLVFSADLGTDQLNIFKLQNGKLIKAEQDSVEMAPGSGPRHFDFHPNKKIVYVINELNSTASVIRNDDGVWKIIQEISTLPEGVGNGCRAGCWTWSLKATLLRPPLNRWTPMARNVSRSGKLES
jgi:6-phosphogluconolactonase